MPRSVVILGAGITGSLLAWRLARAGWHVTVLEARHVGAGSSSRTAAGVRQQFSTKETVVGMRYAVDFYRRFREEVGGDAVPIVQNGYLFLHDLAETWELAQRRVRLQQGWGLREVEALDIVDLHARFPWVDRHALLGGTWCPTDGFLRPETVYNDAMAAAVRLGATLVQGAPVTGVEGHAERPIDAVVTPKGRFTGDLFVDATNAWSPRLGAILGATPLPIAPLKRYLWFIQRAGSLSAEDLAAMPLVVAPSGAYGRPENGDSLLCGWAHDAAPEPSFTYEDQDAVEPRFFHRSGTDSVGFETWAALAEAIPALGEFGGITATTSGYYGTTPDHNPFLDFDPAIPNLLRLVGFSGHGAMFGPFTALIGEALAEAGGSLDTVPVMGETISTAAFSIGRKFGHGEAMVI
jgi:sarcosine oxidase subunit beta